MRGGRLVRAGALLACVVLECAVLAACSDGQAWLLSNHPKLLVNVAAGCPLSVAGYADVVNTFPGPPLAPSGPTSGMVCVYGSRVGSGLPDSGRLIHTVLLTATDAASLVAAVRGLDLHKPTGEFHCPSDVGRATVIGLAYRGRADVGLWYAADGCQTLDNGRLGAFQGANPSFYNGFQPVVDRLAPPSS